MSLGKADLVVKVKKEKKGKNIGNENTERRN